MFAAIPGIIRFLGLTFGWMLLYNVDSLLLPAIYLFMPAVLWCTVLRITGNPSPWWNRLLSPGTVLVYLSVLLAGAALVAVIYPVNLMLSYLGWDVADLPAWYAPAVLLLAAVAAWGIVLPPFGGALNGCTRLKEAWLVFRVRNKARGIIALAALFALGMVLCGMVLLPTIYGVLTHNDLPDTGGSWIDILALPIAMFGVQAACVIAGYACRAPEMVQEDKTVR
nr:hypothetical protein [bacterium]